MKISFITFCRNRNSFVLGLVILIVLLPFSVSGQEDFNRLYEIGKNAFDQDDYISAYAHLVAYWYIMRFEAQRMGLSVDDAFYFEVADAFGYARSRLYDMISRIRVLEQTEMKLRQDLTNCTGISSRGSMLKSPAPKPHLPNQPPGR